MQSQSKVLAVSYVWKGHGICDEEEIIGSSPQFKKLQWTISKLKGSNLNVLITGESGTGKELFARLLNRQEEGKERPFVSVNCAAIPQNLMESVLFGHEKGSFTSAHERRIGKFELADDGDIFLDEISTLSTDFQAKLLRVVQEKEIEMIGRNEVIKVNFRVVSATNEDIERLLRENMFREDLYYRLNAVELHVPPLRERREDILELAIYFLKKYSYTKEPKKLSIEVEDAFINYEWRGNVRELKNTIQNMILMSDSEELTLRDVPSTIKELGKSSKPFLSDENRLDTGFKGFDNGFNQLDRENSNKLKQALKKYERDYLIKAFEKNRWSKTKTSKYLGISRNVLYRRVEELQIESGMLNN